MVVGPAENLADGDRRHRRHLEGQQVDQLVGTVEADGAGRVADAGEQRRVQEGVGRVDAVDDGIAQESPGAETCSISPTLRTARAFT